MNSLEIISFKKNIKDYCDKADMPKEVIRLVLSEILSEVSKEATTEALVQLKEVEQNAVSKV